MARLIYKPFGLVIGVLGGLAARLVLGIGAPAVDAVIPETPTPPDEVIDGALELRDPVLELLETGVRVRGR